MDLKLHANATTTPRIRSYIQKSTASNSALARELGIHRRRTVFSDTFKIFAVYTIV